MKKLGKIFILFSLLLALTGCMKINMNMEVTEDLDMKVNIEMLMQESMLKTMGTSKEEMISSIEEQMESEMGNVEMEPVEKTIDGETWVGVSVSSDQFSELDKDEILKKDGDMITLTLPMDDFADEMESDDMDGLDFSPENLKYSGVEMNLNIKMPGKVTSNVGEVDGDTVKIDLLKIISEEEKVETIEIKADTSKKVASSDNMMLYIAGGAGVVVIALIVFFVIKKKKKAKEQVLEYHHYEDGEKPQYTNDETVHFCPHCGNRLNGEDICPQCHQSVK